MSDYEVGDGPVEWVGDPLRDTLTYRWIDNARAALELIFLDDAVAERYEDWIVRHEGSEAANDAGGAEGDSMVLEQWTSEAGGAVILSAGPRRNDFVLDVLSAGFEASIGVLFDVSTPRPDRRHPQQFLWRPGSRAGRRGRVWRNDPRRRG